MVQKRPLISLEGWVMNGYASYVIDPSGEVRLMPMIALYVDRFETASHQPLNLPSQIIVVEFTRAVAAPQSVWTLGERMRLIGDVRAVHVTRGRQEAAILALRKQLADLDQNGLRVFHNGLWRRDLQLARVAEWRARFLAGKISLDALQVQENRIFGREGRVWLELLARLHDKQLTLRRKALPALLANSRAVYLVRAVQPVSRPVSTRPRVSPGNPANGRNEATFTFQPRAPKVDRKKTQTPEERIQQLTSLRRYRRAWQAAGMPLTILPPVPAYLKPQQAAWVAFERSRTS